MSTCQEFVVNDRYEILGANGWENFDGIIMNHGDFDILKITTTSTSITCTPNHKIYINPIDYVEADSLSVNDSILLENGVYDVITNIEPQPNSNTTYDIFNSDSHKVYINQVLTHQCDELAFVDPNWKAEAFWTSNYPTVSASRDSKIIVISCVTGDTFVYTNKGIKQMRDMINPDISGGYSTEIYNVLGKDITRKGNLMFNSGIFNTVKVTTTNSYIEGSPNHKLYSCKDGNYGWYRMSELSTDDYISIQYGMEIWGNNDHIGFSSSKRKCKQGYMLDVENITPDWAYLFGLYISEGYADKYRLCISCGDDISEIFNKLGLVWRYDNNFHYTVSSMSLVELLGHVGFDITCKDKRKIIPSRLLEMSRYNIIAMLQGIFDGDGFSRKDKGTIGIGLSSKELIEQIRMILLNFGILTDYYEVMTRVTERVKVESMQYRIHCDTISSRLFYEKIGFRLSRKMDNIRFISVKSRYGKSDSIPYSKSVLTKSEVKDIEGKLGHYIYNRGPNGNFAKDLCLRIKEVLPSIQVRPEVVEFYDRNVNVNMKWCKIRDISHGKNEVYDFSLPHDDNDFWCHSVIYNGIIGHQTPNGTFNKFYDLFTKAEKGENTFFPMKYTWRDVPGRDEKWAEEQRKNIGPVKFAQEYDCCFIGSSNTIIDGDTLKLLFSRKQEPNFLSMNDKFRIYEKPESGCKYVLGVDTSKGVGSDYSVIQVIKIMSIAPVKMKQVAVWEDNFTDVYTFAEIVNKMSYYYNNAYIMVENNGESAVVTNRLWWEYENENLINTGGKNKDLGIRATTVTKPQAVLLMKKLIEDYNIEILDSRTVDELTDFQDLGSNKYACVNCNDDLVTSLYWGIYILEQEVFDESYTFSEAEEDEDGWGVLSDWQGDENPFEWMRKKQ